MTTQSPFQAAWDNFKEKNPVRTTKSITVNNKKNVIYFLDYLDGKSEFGYTVSLFKDGLFKVSENQATIILI